MRQASCALLLLLISAATVTAAGAESPRSSWAVIASNSVVESGLLDLLTVKLSKDNSIQLVERERLREVMRELQLAALLEPKNIRQRLQLGKTLGAESLIVLSADQRDGRQALRVVSDSTLGVRLWDGWFLRDDSEIESLAERCVAVVAEVRQRFADGIRHIFAVPPFLSENFEQRFAELGDWERSSSLREAALVLDPNNALQRGLLISEYQYGIARNIFANWHSARFERKLPAEPRAAALQHAADDYVVALNHLEYLVRNKLITRADAVGLFYTQCWYLLTPTRRMNPGEQREAGLCSRRRGPFTALPSVRNAVGEALPWDPPKHAALQPACDPDKRKPEWLQPWPSHLPAGYGSLTGGVSADDGLIAYYRYERQLYRVTILEENEEDPTKGGKP